MRKQTNKRNVFDLRDFGIPRIPEFGYYKYNNATSALKDHRHTDTIEICYFLKGVQRYAIGNRSLELTGNDVLIIAPNTAHSTGIYPEDKGELYWLQISTNHKLGALCHLPNTFSDLLINELSHHSHFTFKGAFVMKSVLSKLELELQRPENLLRQVRINQLIYQILVETVALTENRALSPASERLQLIDDFITEHMDRTIFVDELASLIGLSVPYFKEWFKKKKGVPPKEYMNRAKVERAKSDLLLKSSITRVAFDLGYSSSQYFATTFKKYTGITPKSYVTSLRNQKATHETLR